MIEQSAIGRKLDRLERDRARDLWRVLPWIGSVGLVTLMGATFALFGYGVRAALSVGLLGAVVGGMAYAVHLARAERAFKDALMPDILARVHPGLDSFDPGGLPQERFEQLGIFDKPQHYESKDLVSGRVGATAVAYAMVEVAEDHNKTTEARFEGLLFMADFNKHFKGRTLVQDRRRKLVAPLTEADVELEDPRFAGLYRVMSSNQIEARYILTPRLCERLAKLHERFRAVNVVFDDDCIVLALGESFSMLDPFLGDGIDANDFNDMVRKLKDVVAIVEELNLNTRIWSKAPERDGD